MEVLTQDTIKTRHATGLDFYNKAAQQARHFSVLTPWKSAAAIVFDWLLIMAAITMSLQLNHWLAYFAAALIIGGRQHALFVLMHEGAHFRLARNKKLNDWVSNYLVAFPVFMKTEIYRENHFAHHRFTNSEHDPDWNRKIHLADWRFPKKKWPYAGLFVRYFWGSGFIEMAQAMPILSGLNSKAFADAKRKKDILARGAAYSAILALLAYNGCLLLFVGYWVIPYFVVFPLLNRMRSIAEHFATNNDHELNRSRNVTCRWHERLFFAPHHVSYHLVHHLYPNIPFYNLPAFHTELSTYPTYREYAHNNASYLFGRLEKSVTGDALNHASQLF